MSLSRVLSGIVAIALALGGTLLGGWYFYFFLCNHHFSRAARIF